jgi:hypothetical protein
MELLLMEKQNPYSEAEIGLSNIISTKRAASTCSFFYGEKIIDSLFFLIICYNVQLGKRIGEMFYVERI